MGTLKNGRHEKFCVEVASGKSLAESYQAAGYKKADRRAASRLRQNVDISRRVNELLAEKARIDAESHALAVAAAAVDKIRLFQEFVTLGFSDMGDYADWGPEGVTILPKSELTPEQRRAIQEITESQHRDEDGNVTRRLKIRLVDKVGPLRDLGRHLNFYDGGGKLTQQQAQLFVKNLLSILQRHVPPQTLDAVIGEIREARRQAAM